MGENNKYNIAVLPGDGIGVEVIDAALAVLSSVQKKIGGFELVNEMLPAGAGHFRDHGEALPTETLKAAEDADAILLGAMGLPDVRYPDGTEISPQIDLRFHFGLYAGVRPIKTYENGPGVLADPQSSNIDFVLIRESTEGLFASHGKGEVIDDVEARDTLVITRKTSERLFDFTFGLGRRRRQQGHQGRVTLVDKANVFKSFAFFRQIFDERAASFPEINADHLYVDATALEMVRRPWEFDVLVTENMFGDILSDLAAGLVGGMGFAPSADIGDDQAVFQPAHGTAPDIAGTGVANPIATILSASMMLEWLGVQHQNENCREAASLVESAVTNAITEQRVLTQDAGGAHNTQDVVDAVIAAIENS